MSTAGQSLLENRRTDAHFSAISQNALINAMDISALPNNLSSPGSPQHKHCVGLYEKNAYQCNSGRRVASGHGRWPETL